uniref:Uncharacterized protein n=1 Tax=Vespula pensylvanica TaxID=30213 RepID=A0A834U5K3_VESPE|nr:hypothetical protein H0235_011848 [Vespula pensylvanica]
MSRGSLSMDTRMPNSYERRALKVDYREKAETRDLPYDGEKKAGNSRSRGCVYRRKEIKNGCAMSAKKNSIGNVFVPGSKPRFEAVCSELKSPWRSHRNGYRVPHSSTGISPAESLHRFSRGTTTT